MNAIEFKKEISLPSNIDLKIDVFFPTEEKEKINDENKDYVSKILINQIVRNLKKMIENYKNSELPNYFIQNQNFYITNKLERNIYGMFLYNDDIYIDLNSVLNVGIIEGSFLLGHEEGHKIFKYRNKKEIYKSLGDFLDISVRGNEKLLQEVFADACGNIVFDTNYYHALDEYFCKEKNEAIKKRCLKYIYD